MNNKNNTRINLFKTVTIVCAAFAGFATIIYRFEHPKLTETEVFLKLWKMYACILLPFAILKVTEKMSKYEE